MRPMTNSRKVRLLDRMMARRYREKRARHTKSSARCLRKHIKRSRFEGKASEARREHEQYVQCRRTFLMWASSHARMLGTTSQSVAAASNRASAGADIGDNDDARAAAGEPGAGTRGR
jgi:hypothetical protein